MKNDVLTVGQRELVKRMATMWPYGKMHGIVEMIDGLAAQVERLTRELADMSAQSREARDADGAVCPQPYSGGEPNAATRAAIAELEARHPPNRPTDAQIDAIRAQLREYGNRDFVFHSPSWAQVELLFAAYDDAVLRSENAEAEVEGMTRECREWERVYQEYRAQSVDEYHAQAACIRELETECERLNFDARMFEIAADQSGDRWRRAGRTIRRLRRRWQWERRRSDRWRARRAEEYIERQWADREMDAARAVAAQWEQRLQETITNNAVLHEKLANEAKEARAAGYHEALDAISDAFHKNHAIDWPMLESRYSRAEPTADEKIALAEELMRDPAAPVPATEEAQGGEPAKVEVAVRKIEFWSDGESEELCWETEDEAICGILDAIDEWPTTITIHGYARMKADTIHLEPLEHCLEVLDEELGNPDGGDEGPSTAMMEAEAAFLEVVYREYKPWQCEDVCQKTVDVKAWLREHCPEWLDGHPMEEAAKP